MLGEENLYVPKAVASEDRIPLTPFGFDLCLVFRYQVMSRGKGFAPWRVTALGISNPLFPLRQIFKKVPLKLMRPGENLSIWIVSFEYYTVLTPR